MSDKGISAISPTLVLFCGAPGTGKSTLATSLAAKLDLTLLSHDVIASALADSKAYRFGAQFEKRRAPAAAVLIALTKLQLSLNRPVAVDTIGENLILRERFRSLANEYKFRFVIAYCVCSDHDIRFRRLSNRTKQNTETWGDPGPALIARVDPHLEFGNEFEPTVTLDSIRSIEENLGQLYEAMIR